MEGKDEESTYIFFNGALNFKSFEVSLKRKESILTFDQQRLELCKSTDRIKSFSSKSGCSKSCTKYKKTSSNGLQTSDYKPQALRESSYRPKEPETKPAGEMPLFDQLKIKMRKTSRKLQSALPFFKKTTRRAVAKVRSLCGLRAKRVLGFKCDLKKCDNTLVDCSAGVCRKKSMIFGEPSHPCSSKTVDSNASDASTVSSTSEDRF